MDDWKKDQGKIGLEIIYIYIYVMEKNDAISLSSTSNLIWVKWLA